MVSIVKKSIDIAFDLFPSVYAEKHKRGYQLYHFAFLFKRNKLLAIGQNEQKIESHTALKFAKKFKNGSKYHYKHAEVDCFSKLWGRSYISKDMKMVVLRVNSLGELQQSKPCAYCQDVIDGLGITRVYYSNMQGEFECSA
jgi:hypothetical protein